MKRINHRLLLLVITLLGFVLRVVRLDFQPLWWDEGYSLFFATRDFVTMLERTALDIHPPLYYALLQIWMTFAGKSDVAVRLLSAVIGVLAIPLLYTLARRLFDDVRIALIAALLLVLSPFHIYYSQEIRMYGLVTLLCLASVYLFVQLIDMTPGKRETIVVAGAYILTTTAALYTQYYAAFIVAFQVLYVFVATWRDRRRGRSSSEPTADHSSSPATRHSALVTFPSSLFHWFAAWFTITLLYLPWVVYAGPKLYAYVTNKNAIEQFAPLDPFTYLAQHLVAFSTGHLTAWTWLAWSSAVVVGFAGLGFFTQTRRHGDEETRRYGANLLVPLSPMLLVSLFLFVPFLLGYLVNLRFAFHPVHNERLMLPAAPAFYLFVAIGLAALWKRRVIFGVVSLLIVAAISFASLYDFYTVPRYPNDDYRPLIAEMQTVAQPGDLYLAMYPWQIGYLETYYAGSPLTISETPSDTWIKNPGQMQRELDMLLAQHPRVWLPALQTQGRILEDALDANLRPRAYSIIDNWHGTTRLEYFALGNDPILPLQLPSEPPPRNIAFEDGVTLSDVGVSTEPVIAGQDIVRIKFTGAMRVPGSAQLSLRLIDSNGNVWAQSDREIARDVQRIGLAIPTGTPPGDYDLRATAYRVRDNSALRLEQDPSQTSVSLATMHVTAPIQPGLATIPHRTNIDFGNGIRLVGYDFAPRAQPGEPVPLTLFWQANRTPQTDYAVSLQIKDGRGNVFGTTQAAPARGIYPPTHWQPNEVIRDPQTITPRNDAPDGNYHLSVTLGDEKNAREIGTISVKGRQHYFGAPTPSNKIDARLGDVARLIGYDVNQEQNTVRLILYWQALGATQTSYKVFVHLVDANGTTQAQRDQVPGDNAYPTASWVKGEYLADVYEISAVPPGDYEIRVGMYDPTTNVRLPSFDAANQPTGDHIVLSTRINITR